MAQLNTRSKSPRTRRRVPRPVGEYMTRSPQCVSFDTPVAWAHDLMRKAGIRHLPVLRDGNIVGIVSLADLNLFESTKDALLDDALVGRAMHEALVVEPEASVAEVAATMAARKLDAVIIADSVAPVGIFTSTDALRAILELSR